MKNIGKTFILVALSISVLPIAISFLAVFINKIPFVGDLLSPVLTVMYGLHWISVGGMLLAAPLFIVGSIIYLIHFASSPREGGGNNTPRKVPVAFLAIIGIGLIFFLWYLYQLASAVQPWNKGEEGVYWTLNHEVISASPAGYEVQFSYQAARKCKTGDTPTEKFTINFKDGTVAKVGCKGTINHVYTKEGFYSVSYNEKDMPMIYTSVSLRPVIRVEN